MLGTGPLPGCRRDGGGVLVGEPADGPPRWRTGWRDRTPGRAEGTSRSASVMVALDTASRPAGGASANTERAGEVIVIDHHRTNPGFGSIVILDPDASSTAELVFRLVERMGRPARRRRGVPVRRVTPAGSSTRPPLRDAPGGRRAAPSPLRSLSSPSRCSSRGRWASSGSWPALERWRSFPRPAWCGPTLLRKTWPGPASPCRTWRT